MHPDGENDTYNTNEYSNITDNCDSQITANYSEYLNKVWVYDGWHGGAYNFYTSFVLTKIENNVIEGKYTAGAIAIRGDYWGQMGVLSGAISDGVAECTLEDYNDYCDVNKRFEGNVQITFIDKNSLEVSIGYANRLEEASFPNGVYRYKPYNIKDMYIVSLLEIYSYPVKIDSWGAVELTVIEAGPIEDDRGGLYAYFLVCLSNQGNDFLYEFGNYKTKYYGENHYINGASVADINEDGLDDIILDIRPNSVSVEDAAYTEWQYLQVADGTFILSEQASTLPVSPDMTK